MRQMVALWKREYLEHRGAFVYAPLILLGIVTFGIGMALALNKFRVPPEFAVGLSTSLKFYEIGFLGMTQVWFFYLMGALFFYFADAFSADRRNNAMFFWKSMPISDFKILGSKMLAGMIVFPAILFLVALLSGVILYALTLAGVMVVPRLEVPGVLDIGRGFGLIAVFDFVYVLLALLWYAPFFAWVGALSTVFRRWSIPLAILIPVVLSALENAAFYGVGPQNGYLYTFLSGRILFGIDRTIWMAAALRPGPVDVPLLLTQLVAGIDWISLGGGLVVAALFVFAASEYRRRRIET